MHLILGSKEGCTESSVMNFNYDKIARLLFLKVDISSSGLICIGSADLEGETAVDTQLDLWKKYNKGKSPFDIDLNTDKKSCFNAWNWSPGYSCNPCFPSWLESWNAKIFGIFVNWWNGMETTGILCLVECLVLAASWLSKEPPTKYKHLAAV